MFTTKNRSLKTKMTNSIVEKVKHVMKLTENGRITEHIPFTKNPQSLALIETKPETKQCFLQMLRETLMVPLLKC